MTRGTAEQRGAGIGVIGFKGERGRTAAAACVVLLSLSATACSSGEPEEPPFAGVDACAQFDGELAVELTGIEKGTAQGASDQRCSWQGGGERGDLKFSVLPPELEGNGVFEALSGTGECRRPVKVEAVDSCWQETDEGVTVLVKLKEMVLQVSWRSPAWQKMGEEPKKELVDRLAQAAARGL